MWLSEQQKRPARPGEGHTGVVTMSGEHLAVQLDSEVRALELYGPAGYHWIPKTGDRVLVIKGEGERPCLVGVQNGGEPDGISLRAGEVRLEGSVLVNGEPLEDYVRALAAQVMEEAQ